MNEQNLPCEESAKASSDVDLRRLVAELEASPFVQDLQTLKPNPTALNQHRLMFEAGRESALTSTPLYAGSWSPIQAALLSSIASVAATVLIMSVLTGETREAVVHVPEVASSVPQDSVYPGTPASGTADEAVAAIVAADDSGASDRQPFSSHEQVESRLASSETPIPLSTGTVLTDWRQRTLHVGGEFQLPPETDERNQAVPITERKELRHATQRQQWLTALRKGETFSDAH